MGLETWVASLLCVFHYWSKPPDPPPPHPIFEMGVSLFLAILDLESSNDPFSFILRLVLGLQENASEKGRVPPVLLLTVSPARSLAS